MSFAAALPGLVRLVHLSGYRVGGQDPASVPWTAERVATEYRRLGAYEASKVESDAVVQAHAATLGVPLTIVNPLDRHRRLRDRGVAADPRSGYHRPRHACRPPAGGRDTFVPVDYLATFTALLLTREDTAGHSYWVLDDTTPALPALLRLIGDDHDVKMPRFRVPAGLLTRLPAALTRADPRDLQLPVG